MKNKGLGRGLNAIFETEAAILEEQAAGSGRTAELEISRITPNPRQPRTAFDEEALAELAESIRTLGVIQPITVRREADDRYVIISGERRWRASQIAGLERIPAYVREADDQTLHEMALVENIQREDLNAMEIAISLQRLIDECGVTQETVAARVGKKRSTVANYLRLLTLPPEVQLALKNDEITMGHAKAIASAPERARTGILHRVTGKGLSVRQTEELVRRMAEPHESAAEEADTELPDSYTRLVEQCARIFGDDIKIRKTKGGGRITIGFTSDDDIALFLDKLENLK